MDGMDSYIILGVFDRWTFWTDRRHLTDWRDRRKEWTGEMESWDSWTDGNIGQIDELD